MSPLFFRQQIEQYAVDTKAPASARFGERRLPALLRHGAMSESSSATRGKVDIASRPRQVRF